MTQQSIKFYLRVLFWSTFLRYKNTFVINTQKNNIIFIITINFYSKGNLALESVEIEIRVRCYFFFQLS